MIAIIDYGMGNLHSIAKALEHVGGDVRITSDHAEIKTADRIVLPGVGAFRDGMQNLRQTGLDKLLQEEVMNKKKSFWGICLGMQMIAKKSFEMGEHEGLGWIDATVEPFAFKDAALKVPHVGWNTVRWKQKHPLLEGLKDEEDFYFVHSYHLVSKMAAVNIGICNYGYDFVASISASNLFATQFHPEKSQKAGLQMLRNFLTWNPNA